MNTPLTVILFIIQLALKESYEDQIIQNASQVSIYNKPEELHPYYVNLKSPEKKLESNYIFLGGMSSNKITEAKTRQKPKNNITEILDPLLPTISQLDNRYRSSCDRIFNKITHPLLHWLCRPNIESFNDVIHHRFTRSVIKSNTPCPLSKEKLLVVKNKINEIISQASKLSNACGYNESDSNNCIQWLKLVQCSADFLKCGLNQTTISQAPIDEINKWDVVYKRIIYSYKHEGNITKDSFSQELKQQFDLLGANLQATESVINDIKRESENSQIKKCIENISQGNIANAIRYFNQIKKNSVLIDITTSAYVDHGQLENLKKIIDFGSELSSCSQNVIVFVTLFDLMKNNDVLNSPHTMLFLRATKRCMKNTPIESKLKENTQKIIESWSDSITKCNYNHIIRFLNVYGHDIREYYPDIIEKAYAQDLKNVRAILKFIRENNYVEDKCLYINALFENMRNNNNLNSSEQLAVAFTLKEIMARENYQHISEDFKNTAVGLKNSLYTSVKNLIWGGVHCTIKSKAMDGYLYSSTDDFPYDIGMRTVLVQRDAKEMVETYWNFIPNFEEDEVFFEIKNTLYREYLYAASNIHAYDSKRRKVFTWRILKSVLQGWWIVIPLNDGEDFAIKNTYHGEYLYAENRILWNIYPRQISAGHVFTWRGNNSNYISSEKIWQIKC